MDRATPVALGNHERLEWRGPMIIIMRATLHDHAPNTYYGQWPGEKALFAGLELPAIANNELRCMRRICGL